jgi:hypothetical protein
MIMVIAFVPFILLIIIYVLIGIYVNYDNKKMLGLGSVFQYKHNIGNAYVEYRQWKFVWGLLIDSQKDINRVIDEWNDNGFTCIGFQKSFLPNVPIIKILVIIIITVLTFGFVNYYTGPTLLFVHSDSLKVKSLENKPNI